MKLRDGLQQAIYVVINPVVKGLIKVGFTPNGVTFVGFLINVIAAALVIIATPGLMEGAESVNYSYLTAAGLVLFGGSLFDMLDGQVARLGNMSSTFGAMFDSVLDRYSEMTTLLAVCVFFFAANDWVGGLVTFIAMVGSIMVSYVRARAEGLRLECKVGFLQRPERCVITFVAIFLAGILKCEAIIFWAMVFIALFANITAIWRVIYCKRQIEKKEALREEQK